MLLMKQERHSMAYLKGWLLVTAFSGRNLLNSLKRSFDLTVHTKLGSAMITLQDVTVTPTTCSFLGGSYSLHYIREYF